MGDAAVAVAPRLLHAVQRLAHRAVADGVDVDQPAAGVGGADQFAEVRRVDQQFALLPAVAVGLEERGGLCRVFRYAVGEHLDSRQGQVGAAEEALAHLVQHLEVGRPAAWVGDQEGGDVGAEFAALGQALVDRQHADGVLVGPEAEQGVARRAIGGRVHPGGQAQRVAVAHRAASGF